jgi:L,D-transpeptidase catalytic domain/Putative peptidoglycan binding domain
MHGEAENTRTASPLLAATPVWRVVVAAAAGVFIVLAVPTQASATAVRYGDRGRAVVSLQQRLVALGYLKHGEIDGRFGDETWYAVIAFQGWEQIERDGVVGPKTRRALRDARPPQPWQRLPRALEIDLTRQVLLVVEGGVVRRVVHASTGAQPPTPQGRFSVVRRLRRSWSRRYHVWLQYALYFQRGFAIHAFPIVPDQPASHGCVRIPVEDARFVFDAALLGTPVLIRGRTAHA